jgi:hypothetical protein
MTNTQRNSCGVSSKRQHSNKIALGEITPTSVNCASLRWLELGRCVFLKRVVGPVHVMIGQVIANQVPQLRARMFPLQCGQLLTKRKDFKTELGAGTEEGAEAGEQAN